MRNNKKVKKKINLDIVSTKTRYLNFL